MKNPPLKPMLLAPVRIAGNLVRNRHVISQMLKTDIRGKFAGSLGGLAWQFLHPLLMLAVYLFVFLSVFKLRIGGPGSGGSSVVYLMAGLFPWMILSEGLSAGTNSIIQNGNLIKRTYFPREILPAKAVLLPFLGYGVSLFALLGVRIASQGIWQGLLWLPVAIAVQFIFTFGLALMTATLAVYLRDITHLVQLFISFWIFLTPILYSTEMLPGWTRKLMFLNPLYPLVFTYQSIFIQGKIVIWPFGVLALGWTAAFAFVGGMIFDKFKEELADWL